MSALAALRGALPDGAVLTDPAEVAAYGAPWRGPVGRTEAVVRPGSLDELRETVRWAVRHRTRLVPQGANTGLVGSGVPGREQGSVVLSTSRLTSPLSIDAQDGVVTAAAGVLASAVQAAAAPHRLFLPIDLSADASVGGLIATNAGGCRVLRYGDVRRRTLALQAVLADDEATVVGDLRALRKRNEGPRLTDLMIGSGGQLGIVVAAAVELAPVPDARSTCFLLPRPEADLTTLTGLIERSAGGRASAIELLSRASLQLVADQLPSVGVPFLPQVRDDAVLLELEQDEDQLLTLIERLPQDLLDDVVVVKPERAWAIRHALSEAQSLAGHVIGLDVGAPRGGVHQLRCEVRARLQHAHPDALLAEFGHLGDGGLHLNVVMPAPGDGAAAADIRRLVYAAVQDSGGTFSAEHGLGPSNLAWWSRTTPAGTRHALARIKQTLDPAQVLGNAELAAALADPTASSGSTTTPTRTTDGNQ